MIVSYSGMALITSKVKLESTLIVFCSAFNTMLEKNAIISKTIHLSINNIHENYIEKKYSQTICLNSEI